MSKLECKVHFIYLYLNVSPKLTIQKLTQLIVVLCLFVCHVDFSSFWEKGIKY